MATKPIPIAGHDLAIRIGVTCGGRTVIDTPRSEAVLDDGVLRHFGVTVDPGVAALTLPRPCMLRPRGVPLPVRVSPASGIAVTDAPVGNRRIALVLDAGALYTWLRGRNLAMWLGRHP